MEGLRPTGPAHNLLMQFSNLGNSQIEISAADLFSILAIQNDQVSYVKHVLALLNVYSPPFGCFGVSTGSQRGWGTTALGRFKASAAQKSKFPENVFFWYFINPT